jgi:hypothetical protein
VPKPASDRQLEAELKPAVKRLEEDLREIRQGVKRHGELWDVRIFDFPTPGLPAESYDEPPIVVHFLIGRRVGGDLYVVRWSINGYELLSTTESRTPLQTYAKAAIFAVEDALAVRDAHGPDDKPTYNPLPPEVAYQASVTNGKLNWGRGTYLVVDGQLQDLGGHTPRPRSSPPRVKRKSGELEARIPRAVEEYRRAIERGSLSPTADVARALNVGRSTAARALAAAREQGLLGPALRNRAGERSN